MPDPSTMTGYAPAPSAPGGPVFENLAGAVQKDVGSANKLPDEDRNSKTILHYARDRNNTGDT